ncbi:MAG TPA: hypothetical protein VHN14_35550 [Kofleriaceae bacterium]|nr:hypothetical protein [Kofleriaceae bacterium]
MRRGLRGIDHAGAPALPLGEALHPVALAAIALLIINDWVLKPRFGPSAVTGKLSDLAGLAFAPIVLSAATGLGLDLAVRLGARVDPSLSRCRLVVCTVATGAVFAAVKLDPSCARIVVDLLSRFGRPAAITLDPTDLLCLPALAIAVWIGRDELRRVPLGRPAAIHRLGRPAGPALADVRWAGGGADRIAALADAIDRWDVAAIEHHLSSRAW